MTVQDARICPLCEDDGDAREAIEEREGVYVCFLHALAYDLDQDDMRERVRAALDEGHAESPFACDTCQDEGVVLEPDPKEAPTYESGPYAASRPCPDCSALPRSHSDTEDR